MVFVTIALLLSMVALGYVFLTWNFGYWQKRKVPGPKPQIFTGNYPNLYKSQRHTIYDINDIYRAYKNDYDAVGIFLGRSPQLLVTSPDLAHRVFVADFKSFHDNELSDLVDEKSDFILANDMFSMTGEKWKQCRALITPGLTMSRIKTVYPVTNDVCGKMTEFIKKQIRMGLKDGINGKDLSLRFTTEMLTDCVLGLNSQSFTDNPTPIMAKIRGLFDQSIISMIQFLLVSIFPLLRKLKNNGFIPKEAEQFFVDLMQSAIDARQSQLRAGKSFDRVDFLDYMMDLARKQNLDTRQLTGYTMMFLIDGFDTTASVLSHTLLLLGRDSAIQRRLREEIKAHLNDQGAVEFDKLHELPYLDACILESLRLFSPLTFSSKICTQSIELPNRKGNPITIDKGTIVIVPHTCYMKDEDYFPNPEVYQPERFMEPDAAKKYRERGVFMGFGDGPRSCIGKRFALTQIKAAIVEILMNFDIKVNPKTRKDNLYDNGMVTKLKGDVWLDFVNRK